MHLPVDFFFERNCQWIWTSVFGSPCPFYFLFLLTFHFQDKIIENEDFFSVFRIVLKFLYGDDR
jgi:hypothetical protein